jgi:hypothetical protein
MKYAGTIHRTLAARHGAGAALAAGALAAVIVTALPPGSQARSQLSGVPSGPAAVQTAQLTTITDGCDCGAGVRVRP